MKKLLYFLIATFLLVGCYKEEPDDSNTVTNNDVSVANFQTEFVIPEKNLFLGKQNGESVTYNLESNIFSKADYADLQWGYVIDGNNISTIKIPNQGFPYIFIINALDKNSVLKTINTKNSVFKAKIDGKYIYTIESVSGLMLRVYDLNGSFVNEEFLGSYSQYSLFISKDKSRIFFNGLYNSQLAVGHSFKINTNGSLTQIRNTFIPLTFHKDDDLYLNQNGTLFLDKYSIVYNDSLNKVGELNSFSQDTTQHLFFTDSKILRIGKKEFESFTNDDFSLVNTVSLKINNLLPKKVLPYERLSKYWLAINYFDGIKYFTQIKQIN